jgi:tetratricopeptide (TPR) repeat protein
MNRKSNGEDKFDFELLLKQYENLKNGRPASFFDEDSFERIIEYFEDRDELKHALEACDFGISIFPYSGTLMIKKADLLLDFRAYKAALKILEKVELMDGMSPELCILKTEAYLALDRQQEAIDFLEKALPTFEGEDRIELLFELCDVYDDYEEFDKVFDVLVMILKEDPLNEEALYKICFWTDFTGRNEESIRIHEKIIDDYPYSELAWFNLAAAYQGLKLYEKAIDAYMYCIAIDEKFDYAYRNMGDAYIRMRKYKDAIEMLEKVLELSRPEEVIYDAIGYCYDKLHNWAQARFHYKKASHLNPSDSKMYYKIACTYHNEGSFDAASKQLDQALKMDSGHPDYNLAMGLILSAKNLHEDAVPYFLNVIKARPKNLKGWTALVECFMHSNNWDKAAEFAQLAYIRMSRKTIFLYHLVAIHYLSGNIKEALTQLQTAMQLDSRMVKKLSDYCPQILQNPQAVDIISQYKKRKF